METEPLPPSFYHPVPEIIAVGTRETTSVIVVPGGLTPEEPASGDNDLEPPVMTEEGRMYTPPHP
ncbi:MAG: hypothetical protein IBX71_06025 [Candidatus Desulforudis sp.]|nr:hypothetical protein [Desulforudis sp.]